MKTIYIKDIKENDRVDDIFLLCEIKATGIDKNGAPFMKAKLMDNSGIIDVVKWSLSNKEVDLFKSFTPGKPVRVRGMCNKYKGTLQIKLGGLEYYNEEIDSDLLIKKSPEDSLDMFNYLKASAMAFKDEELKSLCIKVLDDNKDTLLYYPAALSMHHAIYGGLLYHTKRMFMMGKAACLIYPVLNKELLLTGIILHDIQKINEINANEYGIAEEYSIEGKLLGHLVMGVRDIRKEMEDLHIDKEKIMLIEHMILSHHGVPEWGSPKLPMIPEAEMLHHLDNTDAKMEAFEETLESMDKGEIRDWVDSLDKRNVYKAHI